MLSGKLLLCTVSEPSLNGGSASMYASSALLGLFTGTDCSDELNYIDKTHMDYRQSDSLPNKCFQTGTIKFTRCLC